MTKGRRSPHGGKTNRNKPLPVSQAAPDMGAGAQGGIEAAMQNQGAAIEDMAKRLNTFQGPWSAVPHPDDDNAM